MKNQKQNTQEAILAGTLIAGFIQTNPKAYKLTDASGLCGSKQVLDSRPFSMFIRQNLKTKTRTSYQRISDMATNNFGKATGYGLNRFDSRLEEGRFAQYNVVEIPLNVKKFKSEEEVIESVTNGFSWLSASANIMDSLVSQDCTVISTVQSILRAKEIVRNF